MNLKCIGTSPFFIGPHKNQCKYNRTGVVAVKGEREKTEEKKTLITKSQGAGSVNMRGR